MASTLDRTRGARRPNLLYILSDQHCPFVTGCYGDALVETPHLDGLAAAGVTMDAAYCPSPICGPSRMSMLTGLHPFQNRSWTNRDILDSGIPTMAHALGAAGRRPVLIGRLHSMGPDQRRGYAERLVGDHSPNYAGAGPVPDRGALNGTAGPDHVSLAMSGRRPERLRGARRRGDRRRAVRFLQREGDRRRADPEAEPFCLTVGLMLPHPPYVARAADYRRYADRIGLPRNPEFPRQAVPEYLRWWREHTGLTRTTDAETQRSRAAYWGLVSQYGPDDRPHPGGAARRGPGGGYAGRLHLRPRRHARRARHVLEAHLLRGVGTGTADPGVAGPDRSGHSLRPG